jgi:general secretion pathway protein J
MTSHKPLLKNVSKGFTLIEVLVAIGILALMAVLSWRGLDGMTRSQEQTQQRMDEVQTLQTGLAQWSADLDALLPQALLPQFNAIDWDGRLLRVIRRSASADGEGLLLVGWTRRLINGQGFWLRWQSPPLRTRAALADAWQQADLWAQNPGDEAKKREVAITPLEQWQIFFFRSDAWVNPLSSAGATVLPPANPASAPVAPMPSSLPDGVRLLLTLPAGRPLSGTLTRDWVRPTQSGGKS